MKRKHRNTDLYSKKTNRNTHKNKNANTKTTEQPKKLEMTYKKTETNKQKQEKHNCKQRIQQQTPQTNHECCSRPLIIALHVAHLVS